MNQDYCIPSGGYEMCVDFSYEYGWFDFGDLYFDGYGIMNGWSEACQTAEEEVECVDSYEYEINYSSPCSATEDYVFTMIDSDSGGIVWEGTSSGCNWNNTSVCLPEGNYKVVYNLHLMAMVVTLWYHLCLTLGILFHEDSNNGMEYGF